MRPKRPEMLFNLGARFGHDGTLEEGEVKTGHHKCGDIDQLHATPPPSQHSMSLSHRRLAARKHDSAARAATASRSNEVYDVAPKLFQKADPTLWNHGQG
jgi:hypothetical protein